MEDNNATRVSSKNRSLVKLSNGTFAQPTFVKEVYFRCLTNKGGHLFWTTPPTEEAKNIQDSCCKPGEFTSPLDSLDDVWSSSTGPNGEHPHYVRARDGSSPEWLLLGHEFQTTESLLWHTAFKLYPKAVTHIFENTRRGSSQVTPPSSLKDDFLSLFTHVSQSLGMMELLGLLPGADQC